MDVRMPSLDGIAAARAIEGAGTRTRLCVLTTHGLDEYPFGALAAGATALIAPNITLCVNLNSSCEP